MLQITIEPRRAANLRQAVVAAVESGDYDSLCDDIRDCFTDDQVELIEEILDSGDIAESIDDIVADWNGEDVDELFEGIETYFEESAIEVQLVVDDAFEEEAEFDAFAVEDDDAAEDFETDDLEEDEDEEDEDEDEEDEEEDAVEEEREDY